MPIFGLVFHVRDVDGDAALFFLGGIIDGIEGAEISASGQRCHFGDRRSQRRFPVVDVPHRAHVQMRFAAIEFFLSHSLLLLL